MTASRGESTRSCIAAGRRRDRVENWLIAELAVAAPPPLGVTQDNGASGTPSARTLRPIHGAPHGRRVPWLALIHLLRSQVHEMNAAPSSSYTEGDRRDNDRRQGDQLQRGNDRRQGDPCGEARELDRRGEDGDRNERDTNLGSAGICAAWASPILTSHARRIHPFVAL